MRKCTAAAWPQICPIIWRHSSSSSQRKEAEEQCVVMASCVRDHEPLCLSSPYSHCQSRWPRVTHGLSTQDGPMSAGQVWAILRLARADPPALPHNRHATHTVRSARDPTISASAQREGNRCLCSPESSIPERHTSYTSTSLRKVRDQAVTSMGQRYSHRLAQRLQEKVAEEISDCPIVAAKERN